jgi:cellulose synthase/poly-beta-1,6-N-acetylglucosamine synthase-like glycosyltransferase
MLLLFGLGLLTGVAYFLLMWRYRQGWLQATDYPDTVSHLRPVTVTVVVAARNESEHIWHCLNGLLGQQQHRHLHWSVTVVDDASDDTTPQILADFAAKHPVFPLTVLTQAQPQGKKAALTRAIAHSQAELIVVTDADCRVSPKWLSTLTAVYAQQQACFITGPVAFDTNGSMVQDFQALDFTGMMGLTAAGIHYGNQHLANGANMAFPRSVFEAIGGWGDHARYASGDDMFLVQAIATRYPGRIVFLKNKNAIVRTQAAANWGDFVAQRLRWGTKNKHLPEWSTRLSLGVVWLFCMGILVQGVALALWPNRPLLGLFGLQIILKAIADWRLLYTTTAFFEYRHLMRRFTPAFVIHTLYIALLGLGSLVFRQYRWKGVLRR